MDFSIALGQLDLSGDMKANFAKMSWAAEVAAKREANLVVFPEADAESWLGTQDNPHFAPGQVLDGTFVTMIRTLARRLRIWIAAGMFEVANERHEVYNTIIFCDDGGELVGTYRKIHLYDAFGSSESSRVKCGDGSTLLLLVAGLRIGVMTCYDLRFPELARALVTQGAQVLIAPSAWTRGLLKDMHFETLTRSRAIENTVYVAAVNQCGPIYSANSVIIDPMGVTLASGEGCENVVFADISHKGLDAARSLNPCLKHVRTDLYTEWIGNSGSGKQKIKGNR